MFPNLDHLIDVNAVKIFLSRNPVPTLLGDILHSLYTRTIKRRGTLMCCIPLLDRWFILHLPRSVLRNEQGLRWSQRLMTLTHSGIHWCPRFSEDVTIIINHFTKLLTANIHSINHCHTLLTINLHFINQHYLLSNIILNKPCI